MFTKDQKIIVGAFLIVAVALGAFIAFATRGGSSVQPIVRGVAQGEAYNGTSTTAITNNVALTARTLKQLDSKQGNIGSIVIASTSAFALTLWDATSTTDISSTTITTLASSTAAGTYQFDVVFTRGLSIDMPVGYIGGANVMWR